MDEIRRAIMNEFADETCCDMFIMVLKQKWPEFVGDLKRRCTVEIVKDTNDPYCKSKLSLPWSVTRNVSRSNSRTCFTAPFKKI